MLLIFTWYWCTIIDMKIKSRTSAQILKEKRKLVILKEIIEKDPERKWSARAIAVAALDTPFFQEHYPTYSKSTAYRDMVEIKEDISETRKELADIFIKRQLEVTEDIIEDLQETWQEINETQDEIEAMKDGITPLEKMDILLAVAEKKSKLTTAIDRAFNRQSSLVPIAVPKQLNIEKRTFNLDVFLEMQKKAELEDGNTIEGTYYEEKNEGEDE